MKFRWVQLHRLIESSIYSTAHPLHSSCVAHSLAQPCILHRCIALPGSPISLARFREGHGVGALEWERCVGAAEGLEPTEQLRGLSLSYFRFVRFVR